MKVCIIGTGYVGLVSGACFAEIGHIVTCVDTDEIKVSNLAQGRIPIYEPGLNELVVRNRTEGRLSFTTRIDDAVLSGVRLFFIAVGTPTDPADGGAVLDQVYSAVESVAQAIAHHKPEQDGRFVFVTKSTVPVGTNRIIEQIVGRYIPEERFAVASNPEFLREGAAVHDFMNPDRIIIGSSCDEACAVLEDLYRPLIRNGFPMHVVSSVQTAELIKYAANAFLATKITFINEIARLSDATGASIDEVVHGVGSDSRIGHSFLYPGPGYGGSCFPKDTQALVKTAIEFNSPLGVVEAVIAANQRHKLLMVRKIRKTLGGSLSGRRIAVLGLAFKANTDDMRDSPALVIVPGLTRAGATVVAYDPVAGTNAQKVLPEIEIVDDLMVAVEGADAIVILTEWPEFAQFDLNELTYRCRDKVVIDLRNIVAEESRRGFRGRYVGLGRSETVPMEFPEDNQRQIA